MEKYSLYIGRYKDLPEEEFSYFSPMSGYMLVYSQKEVEGLKKVLPEKESKLSSDERAWLTQTKLTISARHFGQSMEEATKNAEQFFELLKKELKAEQEKANKG
ncbi:MAG: hypothetical protein IJX81_01165 [Clostridia bacterium]|nr:hypothetical protein [Clostridia bacterium]